MKREADELKAEVTEQGAEQRTEIEEK